MEEQIYKNIDFIPVFLGSDAGAYGMIRSFHEQYGIRTICIDSKDLVFCRYTDIADIIIDERIEDEEQFASVLIEFAKKFEGRKLILMAFCDVLSNLLIKYKELLDDYYYIPTINYDLYKKLAYKDNFYELCKKYDIRYPKTIVYSYDEYVENKIDIEKISKLKFPLVLKASNSCKYWQLDFYGKKKAYKIKNVFELMGTINDIYHTDYRDTLILQEYIPGEDEENYILNCYSDKTGKVKYMCMGNVLLEEKGPTGIGSPSAIMNYYDKDVIEKIKKFLEDIGFVGFSNFDFKYDQRYNELTIFEVNLRLGRSSYYANCGKYNLSKLVVDDYILNKKMNFQINKEDNLWCIIPPYILFEWIKSDKVSDKVYKLIRNNKMTNSMIYKEDLNEQRKNLLDMKMLRYIEVYDFYKNNGGIRSENL